MKKKTIKKIVSICIFVLLSQIALPLNCIKAISNDKNIENNKEFNDISISFSADLIKVKKVIGKSEGVYVFYNKNIKINSSYSSVKLFDKEGNLIDTVSNVYDNVLFIKPSEQLNTGCNYKVNIKAISIQEEKGDLIRQDFAETFIIEEDKNFMDEKYNPFGEFLYFSQLERIYKTGFKELDENGVVKVKLSNTDKYIYNPVTIAQVGLQEYGFYIQGKGKEHYTIAKNQADWLVENLDESTGKWLNNYDFEVAGMNVTLEKPWGSAMAQGQAISLLVRMYHINENRKYLDTSEKALKPLMVDISEGGLVSEFNGYLYYEEYPTEPASYTLNGFMFTLLGLYDLSYVNNNSQAKELYIDGMRTLNYVLPLYDYNNISIYHLGFLTNNISYVHTSEFYHEVHIWELEALYSITKYPLYKGYHDLWKWYLDAFNVLCFSSQFVSIMYKVKS